VKLIVLSCRFVTDTAGLVLRNGSENTLSYTKWKRKSCDFFLRLEFTQQNTTGNLLSVSWPATFFYQSVCFLAAKSLLRLLKRLKFPERHELLARVTDGYVLRGCRDSDYDDDRFLGYDAVCLSRNLRKCLHFQESFTRTVWNERVMPRSCVCTSGVIFQIWNYSKEFRWNLLLGAKNKIRRI
jgi:hypothetical protein